MGFRSSSLLLLLLALLVAGCGGARESASRVACDATVADGRQFEIDADAGGSVLHADLAFDGELIWAAYNVPATDGSGNFEVYAARYDCGGTVVGEPFQVTTTPDRNHVDPAIAIGTGSVLIAWHSDDNGGGPDNLDIFYRLYGRDGTDWMEGDRHLETTRNGVAVTGNTWMPGAAALPDGGFLIAGARAIEESTTFQAFVQRIDSDGSIDAKTLEPAFEPGVGQVSPAVAVTAAGDVHVAFERTEAGTTAGRIAVGALDADASAFGPLSVVPEGAESILPDLATGPDGHVLLAYTAILDTGDYAIRLGDATKSPESGATMKLGGATRLDHSPAIATAPGGGALAWYRNAGGLANRLEIAGFAYDGSTFEEGPSFLLDGVDEALPYAPAITHIAGPVYVVAWSEGVSPDIRMHARFIRLE